MATAAPAVTRRNPLAVGAAVVGVVALYIWDDLLFAAPVVAATAWLGPWPAFVVTTVVYALGAFGLALGAVRAYERWSQGRPSRLAAWLEAQQRRRRGTWAERLVRSGKVLGFVVASVVIGAIVTTWLIRYSGRTRGLVRVAAASSVIFAVGFCGTYTGVAAVVLRL